MPQQDLDVAYLVDVEHFFEGCFEMAMYDLCSICLHMGKNTAVPDRFDSDPPYWYEHMCLVCLDQFLDWMPMTPCMLAEREVTGRFRRRPKQKCLKRRRSAYAP